MSSTSRQAALSILWDRGLPRPGTSLGEDAATLDKMSIKVAELERWIDDQPGFFWRRELRSWTKWSRAQIRESAKAKSNRDKVNQMAKERS